MFIWVGCKLPEDFSEDLRQRCRKENRDIGLSQVAFDVPQHISLKISFPTDRAGEVLRYLQDLLAAQKPFAVKLLPPEQIPGVLWLPVAEDPVLRRLHEDIDRALEQRFGVAQHSLDKEFVFHSTLFQDEDAEKLAAMALRLRELPLPDSLTVDTFLLGTSPAGLPGTYHIAAQIPTCAEGKTVL